MKRLILLLSLGAGALCLGSCYHSTCICQCYSAGKGGSSYELDKSDCGNPDFTNKMMASKYGWDTCITALAR